MLQILEIWFFMQFIPTEKKKRKINNEKENVAELES